MAFGTADCKSELWRKMKIWVVGELLSRMIISEHRNNLYFLGKPSVPRKTFWLSRAKRNQMRGSAHTSAYFCKENYGRLVVFDFLEWAKKSQNPIHFVLVKKFPCGPRAGPTRQPRSQTKTGRQKNARFLSWFFLLLSSYLWRRVIDIPRLLCFMASIHSDFFFAVRRLPGSDVPRHWRTELHPRPFAPPQINRPRCPIWAPFGANLGQFRPSAKLGTHLSSTEQALHSAD